MYARSDWKHRSDQSVLSTVDEYETPPAWTPPSHPLHLIPSPQAMHGCRNSTPLSAQFRTRAAPEFPSRYLSNVAHSHSPQFATRQAQVFSLTQHCLSLPPFPLFTARLSLSSPSLHSRLFSFRHPSHSLSYHTTLYQSPLLVLSPTPTTELKSQFQTATMRWTPANDQLVCPVSQ